MPLLEDLSRKITPDSNILHSTVQNNQNITKSPKSTHNNANNEIKESSSSHSGKTVIKRSETVVEISHTGEDAEETSIKNDASASSKRRGKKFPPPPPPPRSVPVKPQAVIPTAFSSEIDTDSDLSNDVGTSQNRFAVGERIISSNVREGGEQSSRAGASGRLNSGRSIPNGLIGGFPTYPREQEEDYSGRTTESRATLYAKRDRFRTSKNSITNTWDASLSKDHLGDAVNKIIELSSASTHVKENNVNVKKQCYPNDLKRESSKNSVLSESVASKRTGKQKKRRGWTDPPEDEEADDGWRQRLKVGLTLLISLAFITTSSSLLFIVPLIIDPILVGLQSEFSNKPAQCRTVNYQNGTNPVDCTLPSCREGCTVDLWSCRIITVVFQLGNFDQIYSNASFPARQGSSIHVNDASETLEQRFTPTSNEITRATLRINPNGCGYPPEVTCSNFEARYMRTDTVFPCYHTPVSPNDTVAVPYYNAHEEIANLVFALCTPIAASCVSVVVLFVLTKWKPKKKRSVIEVTPSLKPIEETAQVNAFQMKKNNRANGAVHNTHMGSLVSGLTGLNPAELGSLHESIGAMPKLRDPFNLKPPPPPETTMMNGSVKRLPLYAKNKQLHHAPVADDKL